MAISHGAQTKVFVSHSNDDKEGQLFLNMVFSLPSSNFKPYFYAAMGRKTPHAESLRTHIRESAALFLLLSRNMLRPRTLQWVGYEVGIAAERGLPIVVIEPKDDAPIQIPVPGTTHYALRPRQAEDLDRTFWTAVARTACIDPPFESKSVGTGIFSMISDALTAISEKTFSVEGRFQLSNCNNSHCESAFFTPKAMHDEEFFCPVCRTPTLSLTGQMYRYAERTYKAQNTAASADKKQPDND